MFEQLSTSNRRRLWPHQANALRFAIGHLNALKSPCLIRMPTGTGKTGVIACLTRLATEKSSLVLTPWAHLRQQMVKDLETAFWKRVGLTPNNLSVVPIFPSTAKEVLQSQEPRVIVCTFATLNELRLEYTVDYDALAKLISLVIVDEGHYEPALEWGKSVKGLRAKTLILTATPYRNDLKLFRITNPKRSTHHFTHKSAVEKGIIRALAFTELAAPADTSSLCAAFVRDWAAAKAARKLASKDPRAIVCCAGATEIEETVTRLRRAGLNAIGVHEQFERSTSAYLFKDVPDPGSTDSEIWVHQHKLTEGLDDHRFCAVALFTRIRNDRKLIQQIGRILRRHRFDRGVPALLFAPESFSVKAEWDAYLDFETNLTLLDPQHFREVVDNLLDAQPRVEYFSRRFRRRFSPHELGNNPQVTIPPSVLVRAVGPQFTLDEYIEDCTDNLNTQDAVILGPDINGPCTRSTHYALWVYASVRNSRFLQDTSLYEIRLETHCVVLAERFALITDSGGHIPTEYLERHTVGIGPDEAARYLDNRFRPTHVSVDSSIPYDTVLRGADLRGHNLLNIPASLTDRLQICRSARGRSRNAGRRYVGMVTGRLRKESTEEERRTFDLPTFVSWAQDVAKILRSRRAGNRLFQRFMPTCAPPPVPIPRTVCIDLLRLDLTITLANGDECIFKSSCSDIQETASERGNAYTCTFPLEGSGVDDESISLRIEYDAARRRFWFHKEKGPSVRVTFRADEDESPQRSLAEFLNQNQEIILIGLEGGEIVYQGRQFYRIDYHHAEQALLDSVVRTHGVTCNTEKGSKQQILVARRSQATTFPNGSLFRAIANRLIALPIVDDLLICDDLGTECADFLAVNFRKRQLALIHAKAGPGTGISASAFHDIAAQAMKNLVYLTTVAEVPAGAGSWKRTANWNGTRIRRLYRSPGGLPSGTELWNKVKRDIIDSSNPELFVILITTGCCDVRALRRAVDDSNERTPETAQLLHLLDGLRGYARQLGVRLVVYDVPYDGN